MHTIFELDFEIVALVGKDDEEVIAPTDEWDMAMVFTGTRHFRH